MCIQLFMSFYCNRTQREVSPWALLILLWLQVQRRNIKWRVSWSIAGGGKWQNALCTGVVMIKQRIVGSQSKISSMLNRFYNSTSMLTGFFEIVHYMGLDLPLDFVSSSLWYQIGYYCRVLQNLCNSLYRFYYYLLWCFILTKRAPLVFLSWC